MKKLFLFLFVIVSLSLNAQYFTNHAKNINNKDTDGYYYYLPRNIIRLDFVVEEKLEMKGKYSSYAKEMLNTDDYIKENKKTYKIKSVDVDILTESDPNYVFFVSSDEKSKENVNFKLNITSDGILHTFGCLNDEIINSDSDTDNNITIEDCVIKEYCYIPIRDDENDDEDIESEELEINDKLSDKEMAESIINEIKNLRVGYFDLITGYQEVNYGNTINYMLDKIKELESEYLSTFLGKSSTNTFTKTYYIVPSEDKNTINLTKFSDIESFNSKTGDAIKIIFSDSSKSSNINNLSKDDIENVTYSNKLFYRNPANVTMHIMLGNIVLYESRLKISQLGNIMLIPINKSSLVFDTNTGQVLSIIKE